MPSIVLVAGLLSLLAVVLTGPAALFAVRPPREAAVVTSTEPTVVVERGSAERGMTAVTAQLTFPGLPAGGVVDATMSGLGEESPHYVLARSAVRVAGDGPAVVRLAAEVNPNDDVVIEAKAPGRKCSVNLPSAVLNGDDPIQLSCTTA